MLLLAMALQAASRPDALPLEWAHFSRSPALQRTSETVSVATDNTMPRTKQPEYVLQLTRRGLHSTERFRATSRSCPAVRTVLASLHDLEMPHAVAYGLPGDTGDLVLDGIGYELSAPSSFSDGTVTVRSNMDSPLSRWVDHALDALAPCWTKAS